MLKISTQSYSMFEIELLAVRCGVAISTVRYPITARRSIAQDCTRRVLNCCHRHRCCFPLEKNLLFTMLVNDENKHRKQLLSIVKIPMLEYFIACSKSFTSTCERKCKDPSSAPVICHPRVLERTLLIRWCLTGWNNLFYVCMHCECWGLLEKLLTVAGNMGGQGTKLTHDVCVEDCVEYFAVGCNGNCETNSSVLLICLCGFSIWRVNVVAWEQKEVLSLP